MAGLNDDVATALDLYLDLLNEDGRITSVGSASEDRSTHVWSKDFRRCEPLEIDEVFTKHAARDEGYGYFQDASPKDVDVLDAAFLVPSDGGWTASRLISAPVKEFRGRVRSVMPNMAWWYVAEMGDGVGAYDGRRIPVAWMGNRWVDVGIGGGRFVSDGHGSSMLVPTRSADGIDSDAARNGMILTAASFNRRYDWGVEIGQKKGATLWLPTTPRGCLELFRTREISSESGRRDALVHWVRSHYRRKRSGEGFSDVRSHMRGQQKFEWGGLECHVVPARFDVEKAAYQNKSSVWDLMEADIEQGRP